MHRRQTSFANPSRNGHDLFDAASKGDVKKVKANLDAGANIEFRYLERTPLMIACLTGHLEVVKLLVERGADINAITPEHWTPLFIASYNGRLPIVEYLISKKAPVEVVDTIGWSPLIAASYNGHFQVVRVLIKNKADVFQVTHEGLSSHIIARNHEYNDLAEILLKEENRQRRLFSERLQDFDGNKNEEQIDLTNGVNNHTENNPPDKTQKDPKQALLEQQKQRELNLANELAWQGASKGHIQSLYLSIDQGADPLYQGTHPYNCIEAARLSGNRRCCQFLRSMVLFQTRRVKYWTPEDVLLYLEGTLPLNIPSLHIRAAITDYNHDHPYKYRFVDDILASQHVGGGDGGNNITNQTNNNNSNNSNNNNGENGGKNNSDTPFSEHSIPVHTSTTHPYIIVYNDMLAQRQRDQAELEQNLAEDSACLGVNPETSKEPKKLEQNEQNDQNGEKGIEKPKLPSLLHNSELHLLDNTSKTAPLSPIGHDDRHMREIVDIIDGPINGHVFISPKFFSLLDTFPNLTSEEKRAIQSAALCLRHGSPFPYHIKELFSQYSKQFISPEHSLDLTAFSEIQLYLQAFKDIISGAQNLSGNVMSQQPLIPLLIIDEPLDPKVFVIHNESDNLIENDKHYVPVTPQSPLSSNPANFGMKIVQDDKNNDKNGQIGMNNNTNNVKSSGPAAAIKNTGNTPAGTQNGYKIDNFATKSESLESLRIENAKLTLQWWKFIDYTYIQCENTDTCPRCGLNPNRDFNVVNVNQNYDLFPHNSTQYNSQNSAPILTQNNSTPVISTTLSLPNINHSNGISSTPATPSNASGTAANRAHMNTLQLPLTLATTTTTENYNNGPHSRKSKNNEQNIDNNSERSSDINSQTNLDSSTNPQAQRTRTTTTTTTTTQVIGVLSSSYYHSRRQKGEFHHSLTSNYRAHIAFEQAYEALTLQQTYDAYLTTQKNLKNSKQPQQLSVSGRVQDYNAPKTPPKCGFFLKNVDEAHKFRIQLLCDGLFSLPALSSAHRRSLHSCNQNHPGYSVTLTNSQLFLLTPYLIYTTWLLGLHNTVTTTLLNLRGLLDQYPIPSHFDPHEYLTQHSQDERGQYSIPGFKSIGTNTGNLNDGDRNEGEIEPNYLGVHTGSHRFIDFCINIIDAGLPPIIPSFIPAVDKNLFQIRSKWFNIPIDRLQQQEFSQEEIEKRNQKKYLSFFNFIPLVLPTRLLDRMTTEMKRDQDMATKDQQQTHKNLETQVNKNQPPKSAAWRALQKAMLAKQFKTEEDDDDDGDDKNGDKINGDKINDDKLGGICGILEEPTGSPIAGASSDVVLTTTPKSQFNASSTSLSVPNIQDLDNIDENSQNYPSKNKNLDENYINRPVTADIPTPTIVNNAEISISSSSYVTSHATSHSDKLSQNNNKIDEKKINNNNSHNNDDNNNNNNPQIDFLSPISHHLPQNPSQTGRISATSSQDGDFDASRLSTHQKDILTRTVKLLKSPNIQAGRRKSLALENDQKNELSQQRRKSASFDDNNKSSSRSSGSNLRDSSNSSSDPFSSQPGTHFDNFGKQLAPPNIITKINNFHTPQKKFDQNDNDNNQHNQHSQHSQHFSELKTPNTTTPSFNRRTSRTFDTFELLDKSRLSQKGISFCLDNDHSNQQNNANPTQNTTQNSQNFGDKKFPISTSKQRLLQRNKSSGLLLLGQRVLRDVEVICEGNARQSTLEIANLLQLRSKRRDNQPSLTSGQSTLSNFTNDILNSFDIVWMTELHLLIESLGLKAFCGDVGNLAQMVQFFTTYTGNFTHTPQYYDSQSQLLNPFQPGSQITIDITQQSDFGHTHSPPQSPLPRNPFLHRFTSFTEIDESNDDGSSSSSSSSSVPVFDQKDPKNINKFDNHTTVGNTSTQNSTPATTPQISLSGRFTAVTRPVSPTIKTTTVQHSNDVCNHPHHHKRTPSQSTHSHLHNVTTTTTAVQENALLVTKTVIVDVVLDPSSSSDDDNQDTEHGIITISRTGSHSHNTTNNGGKSTSETTNNINNPITSHNKTLNTPQLIPNKSNQTPMTTPQTSATHQISLPSVTNSQFVIPHTPIVQANSQHGTASPALTIFDATQLLSNPFIRSKAMLFDLIGTKTTKSEKWIVEKSLTAHLGQLNDTIESKTWYMCENHCHLACELDNQRFSIHNVAKFNEVSPDVGQQRVTTLSYALGLSSSIINGVVNATTGNTGEDIQDSDIDSDDELFQQAQARFQTKSDGKNDIKNGTVKTFSSSGANSGNVINNNGGKGRGKNGKDGKDCQIM